MAAINQILIDMDGVLVNFFDEALRLHGFDPANYPSGEWEIARALGISANEFWAKLDEVPTFWSSLQPYPWFHDTLHWLYSLQAEHGIKWAIATSPSLNPVCLSSKVEWMRKHIGHRFKDYMIGNQKHLMAKQTTVLIDDGEHNVDPFIAAGGIAVLWPAIWNRGGVLSDPLAFVKGEIDRLIRTDV